MRWLVLAAIVLSACTEPLPIIDSFPVAVSLDAGVPLLGARAAEVGGGAVLEVVVDTASAITVLDDGTATPSLRRIDLELLRYPLEPAVARAMFPETRALLEGVGAVGTGTPHPIAGVIGGDLLLRLALRLDPSRGELRFFPDVAGDDRTQEGTCAAVMPVTLAGGASYVAGNGVVNYLPSKIVVGACLSPDLPTADSAAGADSLLVVATGIGLTVLSRTAYQAAAGPDVDVDALPEIKIYLPYDTAMNGETARLAKLPRMALVGRQQQGRGPCRELQVSRMLGRRECTAQLIAAGCPCDRDSGSKFCGGAATVELLGEIDVAILPDTHPLLQTLRNELRPNLAEVAGLLGMQALRPLVTDIDYPGSRVLFRCAAGAANCQARPRLTSPGLSRAGELARCFPQP